MFNVTVRVSTVELGANYLNAVGAHDSVPAEIVNIVEAGVYQASGCFHADRKSEMSDCRTVLPDAPTTLTLASAVT